MRSKFRSSSLPYTTQAAEGLMRRRWTTVEIETAVGAGIILDDERFELVGGELEPMSPKGIRHELVKAALIDFWIRRMPEGMRLAPATTFRIGEETFFEPDFMIYRTAIGYVKLKPDNVLLIAEIADSSLNYDLGRKAWLYSYFGVRELWVIDAVKLITHIHRFPSQNRYREIMAAPPNAPITPLFAPELAITLGSLELV